MPSLALGRKANVAYTQGIVTNIAPLAVSLGDPTGIGYEIVLRALAAEPELVSQVVLFGDGDWLALVAARFALPVPAARLHHLPLPAAVTLGAPSDVSGAAAIVALAAATDAARAGRCSGLVTAPLAKLWAQRAGFAHAGHTEYLAAACGVDEAVMMFAGPRLRVALATVHCPLAAVPGLLTVERVSRVAATLATTLIRDFGVVQPRVAVLGLNPHAGEAGTIGTEEQTVVTPALTAAATQVPPATFLGPWVPDVGFRQVLAGHADALVALYHDQALIPVKLIDFEDSVNVTLGLPIVRTSPDHGTAFDIAAAGIARPTSMRAALRLARQMALHRHAG